MSEKPDTTKAPYTADEMMTVAAARLLRDGCVCFVGIGTPSAAANLARLTHAPEIATHARQTFVVMKATPRSFVPRLDFLTSAGFLDGNGARARSNATGAGPRVVITDVGILTPLPETDELALSELYPGIPVDEARAAVGWPLAISDSPVQVPPPTLAELAALRALHARTAAAHARPVHIPNRSFSDVGHPESHRG